MQAKTNWQRQLQQEATLIVATACIASCSPGGATVWLRGVLHHVNLPPAASRSIQPSLQGSPTVPADRQTHVTSRSALVSCHACDAAWKATRSLTFLRRSGLLWRHRRAEMTSSCRRRCSRERRRRTCNCDLRTRRGHLPAAALAETERKSPLRRRPRTRRDEVKRRARRAWPTRDETAPFLDDVAVGVNVRL